MSEAIKIERGVPIPAKVSRGMAGTIKSMEVGDSIVLPKGKANSIRATAFNLRMKMVVRRINDTEVRIWRTA